MSGRWWTRPLPWSRFRGSAAAAFHARWHLGLMRQAWRAAWRTRGRLRAVDGHLCDACERAVATESFWSDAGQRDIWLCAWDAQRFVAANTNRATARAHRRAQRQRGKSSRRTTP